MKIIIAKISPTPILLDSVSNLVYNDDISNLLRSHTFISTSIFIVPEKDKMPHIFLIEVSNPDSNDFIPTHFVGNKDEVIGHINKLLKSLRSNPNLPLPKGYWEVQGDGMIGDDEASASQRPEHYCSRARDYRRKQFL